MDAEKAATIGERVRHYRNIKGLSLDDLAKICDLTPGFIGRLERGEKKYTNPTVDTLFKISTALGLSLHLLIPENSNLTS